MAADSSALIQALIDGGVSPAASRVIANALANAATPQFSRSRDVADATPRDQLRMIDADTRRYLLTNLDYSTEDPYQARLQSHPGRYIGAQPDHPYKDAQPVAPVPPLSQNAVAAGDYVAVDNSVVDNAPVATVSLKLGNKSGNHLRINTAAKSVDAIPLNIASPQGLVTGSVTESSTATTLELVVRQLATMGVVLSDGTIANILGWKDSSATSPYRWVVPPGAIMPFAQTLTAPEGWLLCDGSVYSRTVYANLFAAINTTYGIGNGSTTFNVPDLRGHFVRCLGTHGTDTAAVSGAIGARQNDTTRAPRTASLTGTTSDPGDHTHPMTWSSSAGAPDNYGYEAGPNQNATIYTGAGGAHTHTVTITGGGDTETRPKNIALPYYIKT